MSDITPTPTEGAAEPVAPATPAFDPSELLGRFEALDAKIETLRPEPAAPEPAPDPYAELDQYYEDPNAAAEARRALESILSPAVEQATKPLLERIAAAESAAQKIQADLELGDLEARYSRLADDPEYTKGILQEAQDLATKLGNPALASNATIIETLHLARVGRERAAAETPAGGVPTGLEAAGGASPGQPETPDLAQSILRAGGERTPGHQFWGA